MKIVLIGAGSAQFGCGMLEDIFQSPVLVGTEVALLDIDGQAVQQVYEKAVGFIEQHNLDFSISAGTDRLQALKGADFVIISIEVGNRFELWDQDWNIPLHYGIPQVYGENGGPGGLFHALRITPPILDICEDVSRLCPEAFVFCYSNPMTAITTTVLRKFPELKFVGLCHEIASLDRYLPVILGEDLDNIHYRAAGLNHFSVLLEARMKNSGEDVYPEILRLAPEFFEKEPGYSDMLHYTKRTGIIPDSEGAKERFQLEAPRSMREWSDRRLFKMILERFNLLPITSDSHLGEYIPWAHEVADNQGIADFYQFYRFALGNRSPKINQRTNGAHERAVPIIEAIISDLGTEEGAVNIMNKGYIPDLPSSIAVEVPAIVSKRGLEGIAFPDYPKGFCALLRNYTGVYDLTAEAILLKSKDLVIQALLVNPIMTNVGKLPELVEVMIDRQMSWLSYLR